MNVLHGNDVLLASDTYSPPSERKTAASLPQDIFPSQDKITGCGIFARRGQSSCEIGGTESVTELAALPHEADTDVFDGQITVPSSFCEACRKSDICAATKLPSTALEADTGVSISSRECLHETPHAEVDNPLLVQQISSSSQEADSLSCSNGNRRPSSSIASEAETCALSEFAPAESCELQPEEIRWLYRDCAGQQKKWLPFIGYDSLRIECKFRETRARLCGDGVNQVNAADELVIVRGGLYEVDVIQKTCAPIYWTREGLVYISSAVCEMA